MKTFDLFDSLEYRVSLTALVVHAIVADVAVPKEPDPGPFVPDTAPITYPPTEPSGPVGPGVHAMRV